MPPVKNVLEQSVDGAMKHAINRSILATAELAEKTNFPDPDTRPDEVKEFEAKLRSVGSDPALDLIASRLIGAQINTGTRPVHPIKPVFLSVLVAAKPYGFEGDEVMRGLKFGTPILCVKAESEHRAGGSNWRDGKNLFSNITLLTGVWSPATPEQVEAAVRNLFAARPAATLRMYGGFPIMEDGQMVPATPVEE